MPPVEAGGELRVEVIKKLSTGLSPQSVPGQLGQRPLAERTRAVFAIPTRRSVRDAIFKLKERPDSRAGNT